MGKEREGEGEEGDGEDREREGKAGGGEGRDGTSPAWSSLDLVSTV